MGTPDEHRVLYSAIRDHCVCASLGEEWYLSEVTRRDVELDR